MGLVSGLYRDSSGMTDWFLLSGDKLVSCFLSAVLSSGCYTSNDWATFTVLAFLASGTALGFENSEIYC